MKTIFIVSRKADFSASRLMTESALMSQGYLSCGTYMLHDITNGEAKFLGKMEAAQAVQRIKQDENAYKIEEVPGESKDDSITRFTDQPKIFYVSARPLYE